MNKEDNTKRHLQPYVEEVVDEDLLIFKWHDIPYEPDNVIAICPSVCDDLGSQNGEDSSAHSSGWDQRENTSKENALKSQQNEHLVPQRRSSDEGSTERRVKKRMDTDRPENGK